MKLTVLGSSGSWPPPGGATSGYLVTHQGFRLWIDLGTGTLARAQAHVSPTEIDAALITHAHPDHSVDLHMLFYARLFAPEPLPLLPVFMPPGAFDRIAAAVGEHARQMRRMFDIREVEPGASLPVGPFHIRTRPMRHSVPTLGLRLEAGERALAYTADTAPTDQIEAIAAGSDLFLAEATYLERDRRAPLHLTAREAGDFAARAAVDRLILTHLWPTIDREAALGEAARLFPGEVSVAAEGLRLRVGAGD